MAVTPNILICDDDPVVHESLGLYLDNDNFTHSDAYDGRESLEMAQANKRFGCLPRASEDHGYSHHHAYGKRRRDRQDRRSGIRCR